MTAPCFTPADRERLAAVEVAPADADADWLMDQASLCLAAPSADDEDALKRCLYALSRVGPWRRRAAVEFLAEVATGPRREAWGGAAMAALLPHAQDPACWPRCLELARDERVLWGGRLAMARLTGVEGIGVLASLIPRTDWTGFGLLADAHVAVLAHLDAAVAQTTLVALYRSADWYQRRLLFESLAPPAHPALVPRLIEVATGADTATRRAAAEAFGRLGDAAAAPWLQAALLDPDADVRRLADAALAALGIAPAPPADSPTVPDVGDAWSRLARAPRRVPIAFWLDRTVRAAGAYTSLAWALVAASSLAALLLARPVLAPIGLVVGGLWLLLALPIGVTLAWREGALVRHGVAVPADLKAVRRVERTREVRGSRIKSVWYHHAVAFASLDGALQKRTVQLDRPLGRPRAGVPLLYRLGDPSTLLLFDGLRALRVDARGRLRFRLTLASALGAAAIPVVVAAIALLRLR